MSGELTSKKLRFLAAFLKKIEAINKKAEYPVTIKLEGNLLKAWAKDAYLCHRVSMASRVLGGSGFEIKILYGGTSDRPKMVFNQFTPKADSTDPVLQNPSVREFLCTAMQILSDRQGAPLPPMLITLESDLIRVRCLNRFIRDLIAQQYMELEVYKESNIKLLIETAGEPTFDVIESNRILAVFLDTVQALNARAERPISIKKLPHDILQIWVCDAYTAQDVVNLCRNLYGCGIGVRIVYGGTSDRPNLLYDEFVPGFFLRK